MLSLSSSAPPLELRQIGPNTFEVITEEEDEFQPGIRDQNNPSDLGFESQPSSSFAPSVSFPSSSSASTTSLPESSDASENAEKKKKRTNQERCRSYRERLRKKVEEDQRELERLEERNRELRAIVQGREEAIACLKSLLRDVSRKRKGEGEDSDQEGKRKRQ